ncbi:MAG: zinc metalloprotease HtpX [Bacteroidales bacterium]|jgi:heat shock protein HtpX|nr:zinc metalloprotease HtpX [Mariniphaga sp.]NLB92944.1 zinc metalloprotease HtpX [Bacteroidales bacterium]
MNSFKTFGLMAILTFLFLLVGGAVAGQTGMIIALIIAGITNFIGYFYSDKMVLKAYRAQELPSDHKVTVMVKRLALNANLPMPKVYMVNQNQPNAFATGRDPDHAAVAVTKGLVETMNDDELAGVLAHELGHIANRDILIGTIAATLAGAISYLGYSARFGMFSRNNNNRGGSIIFMLLALILAPIAASIIRMAVSRAREFKADSFGAKVSGNPLYLSNALEKLESSSKRIPMSGNQATSHMFIVYPFSGKSLSKLFSTHPPTSERIKRLKQMATTGYGF